MAGHKWGKNALTMNLREIILSKIAAYLERTGMSERTFGLAVCGDHKLVSRIRDSGVTLDRLERVETYIRENSGSSADSEAA